MRAHNRKPNTILISRTDSIGDVVLTFPLCGWIKEQFPDCHLIFLGRSYTKAVIDCCVHIDAFLNWDELRPLPPSDQTKMLRGLKINAIIHVYPVKEIAKMAYRAGIPKRVGTTGRLYHLLYCNALVRLSRKNSGFHEALLNIMLARSYFEKPLPSQDLNTYTGLSRLPIPNQTIRAFRQADKFNLILHPRSKGSAREWPLQKFSELISALPASQYAIFISGTQEDHLALQHWTATLPPHVHNISGKFSLSEFITFIHQCDGLIAASTGPLHLAAALGKVALGLFPPIQPMDPGRWAPIGPHAGFVVLDKKCAACRNFPEACACMRDLEVAVVLAKLQALTQDWATYTGFEP